MKSEKRYPYEFAMGEYIKLKNYLEENGYESEPSGSLRRKNEDVGDIDFVVKGNKKKILEVVGRYSQIENQINKHEFKLKSGICIHTIPEIEEKYEFTLWQSTGPKKHIKWMKSLYKNKEKVIAEIDANEKEIYTDLGLKYICPEDRFKNQGE